MSLLKFSQSGLFKPDSLSWVMAALIVFVAANVTAFSVRYLAGDRNRGLHLALIGLLVISVLTMVFADHLLVLLGGWAASNLLLVRLMIHKSQWSAALNSGRLALKTFALGAVLLLAGFWLLANATGSPQIHMILQTKVDLPTQGTLGLLLIALAAMTQSAAWPFHRWLISSLNSPTPVSALMHAGIVNGGGFLLVRFGPLYLMQPGLLHFLFLVGLVSAVVGTLCKLLQTDIKRMLAFSTMGQMGFMLMQCGMGLFAPAVSHLCWHGLFKAYLFLNAGSVIRENRKKGKATSFSFSGFIMASLAGLTGAWAFARTSGIPFSLETTGCLMTGIAFMASAQLALRFLEMPRGVAGLTSLPLIGLISGGAYGASVLLIEIILEPLKINQAQPLDFFYVAGFGILLLIWLAMNFKPSARLQSLSVWNRLYVMALNAGQPHPQTITASRTAYRN